MSVSMIKRYAHCTCHGEGEGENATPRIANFVVGEEGFHIDDQTFATSAHVHVEYSSRDCDGGHGSSNTVRPRTDDDYDFWTDEVRTLAFAFAISGTLTVETDGEDRTAVWNEQTDEGWSRREIRYCTDISCAHDGAGPVYDQYAQAAGY